MEVHLIGVHETIGRRKFGRQESQFRQPFVSLFGLPWTVNYWLGPPQTRPDFLERPRHRRPRDSNAGRLLHSQDQQLLSPRGPRPPVVEGAIHHQFDQFSLEILVRLSSAVGSPSVEQSRDAPAKELIGDAIDRS